MQNKKVLRALMLDMTDEEFLTLLTDVEFKKFALSCQY